MNKVCAPTTTPGVRGGPSVGFAPSYVSRSFELQERARASQPTTRAIDTAEAEYASLFRGPRRLPRA
jgi:hypothetical protein